MKLTELKKQMSSLIPENAEQEVLWLLERASGIRPVEFPLHETVSDAVAEKALELARRRGEREPLQYILGDEYFGDLLFSVGPGVLIPRPETLLLAETAVRLLPPGGRFCELGAGSGAVCLTVASKRPDVRVFASELSSAALCWAARNLKRFGWKNVSLYHGDLFEPFGESEFDFVAANLPYVPEKEKENLQPEVTRYEPSLALFAPDSGMAVIKRALSELQNHLTADGTAMFEAAPEQLPLLSSFAETLGFSAGILPDLFNRNRFLKLRRIP